MSKFKILGILFVFFVKFSFSQVIYNAYARVTNISGSTFTVANVTEPVSYSFTTGEQVIIMQMQDDVIGANTADNVSFGNLSSIQSAGLWEVKTIASQTRVAGVLQAISFSGALVNTYNVGGNNTSLQIISFPKLNTGAFTTTNNITGTAWNGNIGGVVAIEVGTDLTLAHNITADGIGFRLGTLSNNDGSGCATTPFRSNNNNFGGKGEGIYKHTTANYNTARAKILNGGGGGITHNGGGGGGGNYTAGGDGGPGWNGTAAGCNPSAGGIGGISLASVITSNRIFMGGGGGGAQQNNSLGTSGANGGGIVIVKADKLITTGACGSPRRISANGNNAANTTGGFNDAAGGGGAAGTVVLQINSYSVVSTCSLQIQSNGGNGGSSPFGTTHAGGGAGGQGVVVFSSAQPTLNVLTTANNGTPGCNVSGTPCPVGGSAGSASGTNGQGIFTNISGALPVEVVNFNAEKQGNHVLLTWSTSTETNNDFFTLEKSMDAVSFQSFDKVKSKGNKGNSNKPLTYSAKDMSPYSGTSYYRLLQTDLNGSTRKHRIVTIEDNSLNSFQLLAYPNPNKGSFFVRLHGDANQHVEFALVDISGRVILNGTQLSTGGEDIFQLVPQETLSAGVYILKVTYKQLVYPVKIVVE